MAFAGCLGMCGGFALPLCGGQERRRRARARTPLACRSHDIRDAGRLPGFLGGVVGFGRRLAGVQKVLACAAGAVMVLMGLELIGLLPGRRGESSGGLFAACSASSSPADAAGRLALG